MFQKKTKKTVLYAAYRQGINAVIRKRRIESIITDIERRFAFAFKQVEEAELKR